MGNILFMPRTNLVAIAMLVATIGTANATGLRGVDSSSSSSSSSHRRLNALCWIEKPAVDAVVGSGIAVASQAACVGFDAVADAACELVGGGPEDPFADACALALGIALEAACESALDQGGKMTAAMVNEKLGC